MLHFAPVLLGQGCGRFDYLRVDLITLALRHLDLEVEASVLFDLKFPSGILAQVYRPKHT